MRDADQAECWAAGIPPPLALQRSMDLSEHWVKEGVGEDTLAVWGWRTRSFLTSEADIWLLSFEGAERHKFQFARRSRAKVNALLERFAVLRCEVYSGHTKAIRWLDWLSFRPESIIFYNNEAFIVMIRERL